MTLLEAVLLLAVVSAIECQITFPTRRPVLPGPNSKVSSSNDLNGLNECWTKDNRAGACYEFRSFQFKACSYFPRIDSTNPNDLQHLRDNVCRNTGKEVFFCCPKSTSEQPPIAITPDVVEVVTTTVVSCDGTSKGCVRPAAVPFESECGNPNSDNVVGGQVSERGQWPWLAALGRKTGAGFSPFCGGTLITKQHVITAAHCFSRQKNFDITVRLGEYDTNEAFDGAQDFGIMDMRVGDYDQNTKENDIMLLKLDRPLSAYTQFIKAACLPYHLRDNNFEGNSPTVVGWGIFDLDLDNPIVSTVPLQVPVPVVPIPECRQKYSFTSNTIDNRQMCAGNGTQDSCRGDSGGPLNYLDVKRFRFYVIGLVSFGPRNCGRSNTPGVYLRLGAYLNWIDQNVKALS